jgi:hypothetical protein
MSISEAVSCRQQHGTVVRKHGSGGGGRGSTPGSESGAHAAEQESQRNSQLDGES